MLHNLLPDEQNVLLCCCKLGNTGFGIVLAFELVPDLSYYFSVADAVAAPLGLQNMRIRTSLVVNQPIQVDKRVSE